ncbi:MAG: COX15/CtaA family protein [Gammaproteobacteria bacterium]
MSDTHTNSTLYQWYVRLIGLAACLAIVVVVLGAWVRLTDAGLGCPDWPGCYGSLIVPDDSDPDAVARANAEFDRPLESDKGWHEMIHRYAASTLGLSILIAAFLAWRNRRDPDQPVAMPLALLGVVCFQGLLGMWTVTLLLKPLIVMGHLLGGLTTLGMATWLLLDHLRRADRRGDGRRAAYVPAIIGLGILVCQIALGGWTSSNYAALACPDLPTCNGGWWPPDANFSEGFVMWRGLGVDYEFGVLDAPSRVAIHYTHRLGALVAFLFLGILTLMLARAADQAPAVRQAGVLVLIALVAQVSIGIGVVWFGLPLWLATSHNAVAALLLLSMINLNHATATYPGAARSVTASRGAT